MQGLSSSFIGPNTGSASAPFELPKDLYLNILRFIPLFTRTSRALPCVSRAWSQVSKEFDESCVKSRAARYGLTLPLELRLHRLSDLIKMNCNEPRSSRLIDNYLGCARSDLKDHFFNCVNEGGYEWLFAYSSHRAYYWLTERNWQEQVQTALIMQLGPVDALQTTLCLNRESNLDLYCAAFIISGSKLFKNEMSYDHPFIQSLMFLKMAGDETITAFRDYLLQPLIARLPDKEISRVIHRLFGILPGDKEWAYQFCYKIMPLNLQSAVFSKSPLVTLSEADTEDDEPGPSFNEMYTQEEVENNFIEKLQEMIPHKSLRRYALQCHIKIFFKSMKDDERDFEPFLPFIQRLIQLFDLDDISP